MAEVSIVHGTLALILLQTDTFHLLARYRIDTLYRYDNGNMMGVFIICIEIKPHPMPIFHRRKIAGHDAKNQKFYADYFSSNFYNFLNFNSFPLQYFYKFPDFNQFLPQYFNKFLFLFFHLN